MVSKALVIKNASLKTKIAAIDYLVYNDEMIYSPLISILYITDHFFSFICYPIRCIIPDAIADSIGYPMKVPTHFMVFVFVGI